MTDHEAATWIAFVTRRSVDDVLALGMDSNAMSTLGDWLASNPALELLDPPQHIHDKPITFRCGGCGREVHSSYRTRRPKYCSSACRQRAYRQRKIQALEAQPTRPAALVRSGNGRGFRVMREVGI